MIFAIRALYLRIAEALAYVFLCRAPLQKSYDDAIAEHERNAREALERVMVPWAEKEDRLLNLPLDGLACDAYESYCGARHWKSFNNQPLPQWPDVSGDIREGWRAAANGMFMRLTGHTHPDGIHPRSPATKEPAAYTGDTLCPKCETTHWMHGPCPVVATPTMRGNKESRVIWEGAMATAPVWPLYVAIGENGTILRHIGENVYKKDAGEWSVEAAFNEKGHLLVLEGCDSRLAHLVGGRLFPAAEWEGREDNAGYNPDAKKHEKE